MISELLDPAQYVVQPLALASALTAFLLSALAFAVLIREKYSQTSRAFFLMMIPIVVWLSAYACMYSVGNSEAALFWARAGYIGVPFIPVGMAQFCLTLMGQERIRNHILQLMVLASTFFTGAFLLSPAFITEMRHFQWGIYPQYGTGGLVFVVYFVMVLGYVVVLTGRAARTSANERQRARLMSLFWALIVVCPGIIDYLPKFGIEIPPLGFLPIVAFLIICARMVWKYRLMDITPAFAADQILETMQGAVFVTDVYDVIKVVNQAAIKLMDYPEEELAGHTLISLGLRFEPRRHGDVPPVPFRNFEAVLKRRGGDPVEVDVSASWLVGPTGLRIGIVYVALDVSEKVKEAQRLLEREMELARSSAEKEQLELLTTVMAHDLRTPLNHIGTYADLALEALERGSPTQMSGQIQRMIESVHRLQTLIDGLLRYQTVALNAEIEDVVDLNELVQEIAQALRDLHNGEFDISVAPLPRMKGSRLQLRQLFENLLSNAMKFRSPDRPLRIEVSAAEVNNMMRISVKDNGLGFSQVDAEKIFRPFSRLSPSKTLQGHGLGLAICRRIVTNHKGRIEAFGELSSGAEFVIWFPLTSSLT